MFTLFLGVIYYSEELPPYGLGLSVLSAALTLFPATLAMIFIAPLAGSATSTLGPKPVLIYGSLVSVTGFWLMIFYRTSSIQLVIDSFITGVGIVSIMIPIVNMVAVSIPQENVAVGLGFNTMVRFLGSSVGPVLAATFMTDYKYYIVYGFTARSLTEILSEAGTVAFNYIFLTGLVFSLLTLIVALFAKNYKSKHLSVSTTV